jgi:hypothetical protein
MSTIYKDRLIELTDEEIVFHRYYFPFGGDKHISLNLIERIEVREPTLWGGSWRLWGSNDFRTWFPLDNKRPSRDRLFVIFLRDKYWRIGFTVEYSQKVTDILSERGLLQEVKS